MPVIECRCGMVMSVVADEPRTCCIRCGSVKFRELEQWNPIGGTRWRPDVRPLAGGYAEGAFVRVGGSLAESIRDGSHI